MTAEIDMHRCFRAVLMALALPGRPQASPVAGSATPDLVLRSIWEPEQVGRLVVLIQGDPGPRRLEGLERGSEEEPQRGATALVATAGDAPETAVWLEGPGLAEPARTVLPISAEALESRSRACAAPPAGIDLVLVTREGAIVGLPRTTRVTVER
ncbi:MAG TPA: phosphonate C-P lyase system protein PhnH [Candidatus Dormibacteraeota bacterium]